MIYRIEHRTEYRYSKPVFLEPHVVRLTPRGDPSQTLLDHALRIEPEPMRMSSALDADGNSVVYAWFEELTPTLAIDSVSTVRTLRFNAFDFLFLDISHERAPIPYADADRAGLAASRSPSEPSDSLAAALAYEALAATDNLTLPFLIELTRRLHGLIKVEVREDGPAKSPSQTLADGVGACRDLTQTFTECCRRAGMAARFVSGYHEGDPEIAENHLHAWAEVYLPGGGWRGFDPTLGLAVADRHIILAAAPEPNGAMPVSGGFRGTGAFAEMTTTLEIEPLQVAPTT